MKRNTGLKWVNLEPVLTQMVIGPKFVQIILTSEKILPRLLKKHFYLCHPYYCFVWGKEWFVFFIEQKESFKVADLLNVTNYFVYKMFI